MSALGDCREYLIEIVKGAGGINAPATYIATVNSVNEDARTCSCTSVNGPTDISLDTVLLMSEVNDGLLVIPAIDSTVIIQSTPNSMPVVLMFSQIDKVISNAGGSTLQIDSDGLQLDGNKYGGIMQITPSVKAWNDTQNDINNLKSDISTILGTANTLQAGLAVLSASSAPVIGSALSTLFLPYITQVISSLTTYAGQNLTVTEKSDVENPKVQHGDGS